jgi:hypothetical protein
MLLLLTRTVQIEILPSFIIICSSSSSSSSSGGTAAKLLHGFCHHCWLLLPSTALKAHGQTEKVLHASNINVESKTVIDADRRIR